MATTQPIPIDLTKLLTPYRGEWVALSADETRVLAHGMNMDEVLAQAQHVEHGRPLLLKVPDKVGFVLI